MYIPANIVLISYIPSELTEGMLFIKQSINKLIEVYEIKEVPSNIEEYDQFYSTYGYPVHVEIYGQISDNPDTPLALLANQDAIGWIEQNGTLYDFTIDEVNQVLLFYDGILAIYVEEDESTNLLVPVLEEGLVVVTWIDTMYYDEEDDEDDEDNEEELF